MQCTAASRGSRRRGDAIDFCAAARACGFTSVYEFDDVENWRNSITAVLSDTGPTFVSLKVEPIPGGLVPRSPAPARERAAALRHVLAGER